MTLALDFAARSDRGLVRSNNEDSAVAASHLLALADGMGGHAAGEVASQLMIEALFPVNALFSDGTTEKIAAESLPALLAEAMEDGNRAISAHVDENPTLDGMGCTLSSLLFNDGKLGVCHVGDSRAYRLRDGVLTQITKDDTYVQSLVDEGKLDPADVSSHPQRSLILKALTGRPVEPTLQLLDAHPGDRYMLCSDGLSDPVSADTIRDVLAAGTPTETAAKLIDLALRGGGPDNVTVVVADVVDTEAADAPATLPDVVALAGAIDSDSTELPRPDTAAGRAMAVNVVNRNTPAPTTDPAPTDADSPAGADSTSRRRGIPGIRRSRRVGRTAATDGGADADLDGDDPGTSGEPHRPTRHRRVLIALTVLVALVIALGVGGWLIKRNLNETYFVAVAADEDLPNPATTTAAPSTSASATATANTADTSGTSDTSGTASASETASAARSTAAAAAADGTPILIYQGAPGSFLGLSLNSSYQEICLNEDADIRLLPAGSDDPCHRFSTADLTPAARGTLDTLPRDSYESIQEQLRRLAAQTLPVCVTRSSSTDTTNAGNPADLTTPGVSCREVN
ncbi:PP2C family protein-serine/threonine phosphatase [Corynebacterium terpenotabidum]|uniref:PPM-type phosphatase domain-containing protein n=1 Tax=Corynebacterium terpenotabidum Y-11 TaxID=1200352 RepID=S4XAR7_9CORY|nr:protein phosphatase 2C domain-containing protein [Corynebacterium terpenotabidum]AGP29721.1 hypothetical protein A606_00315 [Corynebacterium terpenotabidum Y-11]